MDLQNRQGKIDIGNDFPNELCKNQGINQGHKLLDACVNTY